MHKCLKGFPLENNVNQIKRQDKKKLEEIEMQDEYFLIVHTEIGRWPS